mgnify:CR=1 FL=1
MPISKNYSDQRYHNLSEEMCVFVVYGFQTIIDFIFLTKGKYSVRGSDQDRSILSIMPSSKQDSGHKINHISCTCVRKISEKFSGSKSELPMSDRLPITRMQVRHSSAEKRKGIFNFEDLLYCWYLKKEKYDGRMKFRGSVCSNKKKILLRGK